MSDKPKPRQEPPIGVRLPPDLRDFVKEQAAKNFRSVSAEVAARVERTRRQENANATS